MTDQEHAFRKVGLGYVLELPGILTTLTLDNLYRTRGEVHGILTVRSAWTGAKTNNGVMIAAQMTITSLSARKTFSKALEERAPVANEKDKLDWYGFLEELCQGVIAEGRDSSPIEEVGELADTERAQALVWPFLEYREPTICYGDGGTGKSMLAIGLAVSVRSGIQIIPGFAPTQTRQVLYLDWETSREEVDRRVKAICAGAGIAPITFLYRRCYDPLNTLVERMSQEVAERNIGLVIADHCAGAMGFTREGGDPAEPPARLFAALRMLDATALVIDHVGKTNGDASKPYGSSYKSHLARATWELRQARDPDSDGVHLGLYHRKHNNTMAHPAIGLRMQASDDLVAWQREEIYDPGLMEQMSHADRITATLSAHPLRVQEIANQTGLEENKVRAVLSRYRGQKFEKIRTGDWKLIVSDEVA